MPKLGPSRSIELTNVQSANRRFIPSRTINVGPPNGSQEPHLVCHEVEGHDAPQVWVTLSHCLGGSTPLKTTLSTVARWQKGIPLCMLLSTFRDAVIITHKLGISHLWIDSLCIIQDSPDDWKDGAARMGDIYKYGLLNIAANTACTCHDSIFSSRDNPFTPASLPLRS